MDFVERIEGLTGEQIERLVEAIWRGEETVTDLEREQLKQELLKRKELAVGEYVKFYMTLYALLEITKEAQANADPDKKKKLTPAQLAGAALIFWLAAELPEPSPPADIELVWHTHPELGEVCKVCKSYEGMVWGVDFWGYPDLHPNCNCTLDERPKARAIMDRIGILQAGTVRALSEGQKRILEVLAAPFGSPARKDKLGQFLSPRTNFMLGPGDKRPLLYFHGFSPRGRKMKNPPVIGTAVASKVDSDGLWMRAELVPEGKHELADRTWEAALEGNARASTGSVNYLEDHDEHTGEVYTWPIAELSVFDAGDDRIPVSDDAVVLPLRALFTEQGIDYTFEAGEDKDEATRSTKTRQKEINMNEVEQAVQAALAAEKEKEEAEKKEREAMRASIIEELKNQPAKRGIFNINTIDDKEAKKNADDEEEFAFYRGLIEDARLVSEGGTPSRRAATALEETEADELGDLVPDQLYNKLFAKLQEYSVVDYLASKGLMTIYQADRLTISAPQNVTHMTPLADIAEAATYVQQVPTFDAKQATMQKVGNYVTVTEEALDDQTLFQSWFPGECARAVALAKNADLYALTNAVAGTDVAAHGAVTDAELLAARYGIEQQYRNKAVWLTSDSTIAYMRGMALAASSQRAYGEFGFAPWGGMGEQGETFMGRPIIANANWISITTAVKENKVIDFINMDQTIFWAERKKLRIFVDPYSTRLSAGTINFLPMARYGGVVKDEEALYGIDGHDE